MKKMMLMLCTSAGFLAVAFTAVFVAGSSKEAHAGPCDPITAYVAAVAISPECPANTIMYFCTAALRNDFVANNPCYVPAGTATKPACQVLCTPGGGGL